MKILFYYREGEQIGIEYISSFLKQAGHETELLFDIGLDSKFGVFKLKGISSDSIKVNQKLIEHAKIFSPDLMAFSSETKMFPYVVRYAAAIKEVFNIPVIVGGVHPTALPDYVLGDKNIDIICIGEGELAMVELANKLERGETITDIKNLWVKEGGKIYKNSLRPLLQDLDSLPFPDRNLFYKYGAFKNHLMITGSRGCYYRCSYCHNSLCHRLYKGLGDWVRKRSVDNFLSEIKLAIERYKTNAIEFVDENFTVDPKWTLEFCEKYGKEIGLPFFCQISPNQVRQDLIQALKKAGCFVIFMGVESGNPYIREKIMQRYISNEEIVNAAKTIKDAGIWLQATAMFGSPSETPEMMWDTINLIREIKPDAMPSYTLSPFPGTALYDYAVKNNLLSEEEIEEIKRGRIGDHEKSIFDHPYRELAYNMSKLMSLYVRAPRPVKPLVKRLMVNKRKRFVSAAYAALLLWDYPFFGRERARLFLRMLLKKVFKK